MKSIKFAVIQNSVSTNFDINIKRVLKLCKKVYKKADFILFPEYFLGWSDKHKEILKIFKKEAIRHNMNFILGSVIENSKDKYYNTCFLIDKKGKIIGKHRKIHLYKKWENKITSGKAIKIFKIDNIKVGIVICLDVYFPKDIIKLRNADIIIVPNMTSREEIDDHLSVLKTRAVENLIPVIIVNAVGRMKNIIWGGKSSLINPEGKIIDKMSNREDYKIFSVNLNETKTIRKKLSDIFTPYQ